jgi:hypothetical protein
VDEVSGACLAGYHQGGLTHLVARMTGDSPRRDPPSLQHASLYIKCLSELTDFNKNWDVSTNNNNNGHIG